MTHPDEGRLNDYADGLLDAGAAAELETHLRACGPCRRRVEAIRRLDARLASLPRAIPPRRDLRPMSGVRTTAAAPGATDPASRPGGPWLRAAAAVAVLAAAGAAVWLALGPRGPGGAAPQDAVIVAYARAADELTAALRARKAELGPAAERSLDENLEVVDAAIRELERARAEGPATVAPETGELTRHLEARWRTKVELLRRALDRLEES